MRWWRRPGLHFVALGALLFGLQALWARPTAPGPVLSPDELLLREARRLGFHETDPLVRRRLAKNMRFLHGAGADRDDAALVEEALALRMDETDPVVRRRLIQKLKLRIHARARADEPSDAELADYLAAHAARFAMPARFEVSQTFLSRDRRGERLEGDARELLARLAAEGDGPEVARAGDAFLHPARLPARSQRELAKVFGEEGARIVTELPAGRWEGPVPSPYGLHLVFVHRRIHARPAQLATVRSSVREALLAERGERALLAATAELRR